jgi:hypothetical protein
MAPIHLSAQDRSLDYDASRSVWRTFWRQTLPSVLAVLPALAIPTDFSYQIRSNMFIFRTPMRSATIDLDTYERSHHIEIYSLREEWNASYR